MPDDLQAGHRFFTPEAVERIIEAANGFPEPTEDDPRDAEARASELSDALDFAATRLVGTYTGTLVQKALGRLPKAPAGPGRPAQLEINEFIKKLQWIWIDVFDGRLRTSRNSEGEGDGPQVRFVHGSIRELLAALRGDRARLVVFAGKTRPRERARLIQDLKALTPSAVEARLRQEPLRDRARLIKVLKGLTPSAVVARLRKKPLREVLAELHRRWMKDPEA